MRGKQSMMASRPETKDSSQNTKDCISFSNLTGTPPDLTLTVRLDNVREEVEGQWRLELTNDVGTGYVDFRLKVEGEEPPPVPGLFIMDAVDAAGRDSRVSGWSSMYMDIDEIKLDDGT
nr:hypothetical protein BaRGS_025651 [Batillaria attramentaria]